jgi:uncharacterized Zn finger protein
MYYYDEDFQYVSVAKRKILSEKMIKKLRQAGEKISPIVPQAKKNISQSFWGKAWCKNLENYKDLDYRLSRGRSYLRAHCVVDLKIDSNKLIAKVLGSNLYDVEIKFSKLTKERTDAFTKKCTTKINSLVDLLAGKMSQQTAHLISDPCCGLFPDSNEIKFMCTCLDYANMCKHIAAALYGVAVLFDEDPNLFFTLRGLDPSIMLSSASKNIDTMSKHHESIDELEGIFDIEFDK